MKLPFDFAIKFLLRLVLPGAFLSAIFWPLIEVFRSVLGVTVDDMVVIPIAILLFGWCVLLLDMPIYMMAEGRRFWPDKLRRLGCWSEGKRLKRLKARRDALAADDPRRLEVALEIRKFPLNSTGAPYVYHPTRLGNLIRTSESYPDRKYGIDGVFGWYRLWVVIDKDLRGEIDDLQAIVDSALYMAFGAVLGAILCLGYAIFEHCSPGTLAMLPSARALLCFAAGCLILSRLFYCGALIAQNHHGELFMALFDQYVDKLGFKTIVEQLEQKLGAPESTASQREKARAAIRFLKWHKHRRAGATDNLDVSDW